MAKEDQLAMAEKMAALALAENKKLKAELQEARASLANWKQVAFEADQANGCLQEERDEARQQAEQAVERQREKDAEIARNPYGDLVQAYGDDQPQTVGNKIADAILAQAEGKK